ncbi:MAG: cation:proton antiporter [Bacteroidota bacterium]
MFYLAAANPNLILFVLLGIIILAVGLLLRYFKQPYIIAYILGGVLIGEHGFSLVTDEALIHSMGDFGLILLLFFIGMEISLPTLIKNWRIPTFGTMAQIIGSILFMAAIGLFSDWSLELIIVLGFITSLSSSAVVIKLLQDSREIDTRLGQNVLSILIMQDILIVPMLIITGYLGGIEPTNKEIILQLIGGVLIVGTILWILRKKEIVLPFSKAIEDDHEIQVLVAFVVCFGCAVLTAFFGLSAALGAFVGGLVVHAARSTGWFHDSLHSFRVVFVAVFFVSIGLLIDITFLLNNWSVILGVLFAVYLGNHFINAAVIHYFGRNWKESLYGGSLLAQVGELSFILSTAAYQTNLISEFEYQLTIITISLTLLISPFWIAGTKSLVQRTSIKLEALSKTT